jgi:hypothetical protein
LALQRTSTGWRNIEARDPDGSVVRLFVDPDKNRQSIKGEITVRRLQKLLEAAHPTKRIYARKADLIVYAGSDPIAKIENISSSDFALRWNLVEAGKLGCDRAKIEADLRAATADRASAVQWG